MKIELRTIGIILGIIAVLVSFGLVMPWDAASKEALASVEEKATACCTSCSEGVIRIETKIDTLIEMSK